MTDVLDSLLGWQRAGVPAVLATVVRVWGSAPFVVGASMAVSAEGAVVGSVSAGCVEGAVYQLALEVLETGQVVRQRFGVADEDAYAVGLSCGGELEVLLAPVGPADVEALSAVAAARVDRRPVGLATLVATGTHRVVGAGESPFAELLATGCSGLLDTPDGETLLISLLPPARLLVVGATEYGVALSRLATAAGFAVTVCDARAVFAQPSRFPDAVEVVVARPHRYLGEQVAAGSVDERSAVCVLSHDPEIDVPLLTVALRSPAGFVGLLGSRRTQSARRDALRANGIDAEELGRLRGPIGLDLAARTPTEIAVSILAEVVARTNGGGGGFLTEGTGPIHHDRVPIPR